MIDSGSTTATIEMDVPSGQRRDAVKSHAASEGADPSIASTTRIERSPPENDHLPGRSACSASIGAGQASGHGHPSPAERTLGPRVRAERGFPGTRDAHRLSLYESMPAKAEEHAMTAHPIFEAIRAFGGHEHRDLARGLDNIHNAGCDLSLSGRLAAVRSIHEVLAWTEQTLDPHIAWEESWLYPRIDDLTRTSWATRAARFDHGQIHAMAARLHEDELAISYAMTSAVANEVRAHLFGFETLLRSHIDREERLLLPVLAEADAAADLAAAGVVPA
jgi:hemerythrin-like domain-containing protein